MSLKPSKFSDKKKIEEQMKIKQKQIETKHMLPPYTLIICEGIKTETNYLDGFKRVINEKYKQYDKNERIMVHGTGRNTIGLLKWTEDQVKTKWTYFKRIWLVYDKDDFPFDNFDNTQFSVEGRDDKKYKVAWSNECIELWFLLHFQDYVSDNGREHYIKRLNEYFEYSKAREDLFNIINEKGSLQNAKRRAEKLYKEHCDRGITSPSKMVPATRVFELIEELERYL